MADKCLAMRSRKRARTALSTGGQSEELPHESHGSRAAGGNGGEWSSALGGAPGCLETPHTRGSRATSEAGPEVAGKSAGRWTRSRGRRSEIRQRATRVCRWRCRRGHERARLEAIAAGVEENCALLQAVQHENAVLRAENDRLENFVREQRVHIRYMRMGLAGHTPLHAGCPQALPTVPTALPWVPHPESKQLHVSTPLLGARIAPAMGHAMSDICAQVEALRAILEDSGIFVGSDRASGVGLRALGHLVSAVVEARIGMLLARHPKPSDLASRMPQEDLSPEEMAVWRNRLAVLCLSDGQKNAIMDMRTEHLERLRVLYEERSNLNNEARAVVKMSSTCPQGLPHVLRLVWEQVKTNVGQCQLIAAEGLRALLLGVLDPVRGALLLVDSDPCSVDVMKVAAAIVAVDGGWASNAHSSASSTN